MKTFIFKSNKDGNGGRRWEGFSSYSPCTYQILLQNGSVGGSVEQVLMDLGSLNPAWWGLGPVWAAYDNDGRQIAADQRLNVLKKKIEDCL
jgi:hypothetical protein